MCAKADAVMSFSVEFDYFSLHSQLLIFCRSYLRGCLPGVEIDSKALGNFKILVSNRIKFPDKVPRPRSSPHEIDTALEDWFNEW
jgi:hypothetical protein